MRLLGTEQDGDYFDLAVVNDGSSKNFHYACERYIHKPPTSILSASVCDDVIFNYSKEMYKIILQAAKIVKGYHPITKRNDKNLPRRNANSKDARIFDYRRRFLTISEIFGGQR